MAYADPPIKPAVVHGIPDDKVGNLAELLLDVRRLRDLGRPHADIRRDVLQLARNLGNFPLYSPGGLAEVIDAVLEGGAP